MKGLPLLLTGMSGSVGGLTFSHNRGGAYVRDRAIPTQPNTFQQVIVKAIFGTLSGLWSSLLTQAQRDDWDLYAAATPLTDKLGQPFFPTGLNMYIRGNTPSIQSGGTRVDAGPATAGLPVASVPTVTSITASTDVLSMAFTIGDAWVDLDDHNLLVYASRGQKASINFFKGPYQFAGKVTGDATTAPTSPAAITIPFNIQVGQKVFFRATLLDDIGRKGQDLFFSGIAT